MGNATAQVVESFWQITPVAVALVVAANAVTKTTGTKTPASVDHALETKFKNPAPQLLANVQLTR